MEKPNLRGWGPETTTYEAPKKIERTVETLCEQLEDSLENEGRGRERTMGRQAIELNAKQTAELARQILTHSAVTEEGVRFVEERMGRISSMLFSELEDKKIAEELIAGLNRLLEKR